MVVKLLFVAGQRLYCKINQALKIRLPAVFAVELSFDSQLSGRCY